MGGQLLLRTATNSSTFELIRFYCHLPRKLREGNVFCPMSVHGMGGGSNLTITHDALDLTTQGSPPHPPSTGTALAGHVQTCS